MTDYIEQLIDKLLAPPVVGPINHDVYQPKLTVTTPGPPCNYTPHCVIITERCASIIIFTSTVRSTIHPSGSK